MASTHITNHTFPLFPKPPPEIQIHIWSFAAMHPRRVVVDAQKLEVGSAWLSTTPTPAVMHACRDARALAPYVKAFEGSGEADWQAQPLVLFSKTPTAPLIQRLRIPFATDCEWSYKSFINSLKSKLKNFHRLRELQITLPLCNLDGPRNCISRTVSYGTCDVRMYLSHLWLRLLFPYCGPPVI
ncbi:hypothetical protein Micbo1qcDRAFT_193833 [Microdochium bolleyi]|uniref:2EXR domain-containing protein n=1 Tax=Microdochium bolleyi TaxID=196109 RepID=A0A136JC84_9PEZI|nr:hypothetical protein Micbo1qcDRAFT_193833 [Microdochium bolleyi]